MFEWVLNRAPMIQLLLKEKAAFHGLDASIQRNMVKENIKQTFEISSISCRRVFITQCRQPLSAVNYSRKTLHLGRSTRF